MTIVQLVIPDENKHAKPVSTTLPTKYSISDMDHGYSHPKKAGTLIVETLTANNEIIRSLEKQEYSIFDIENGLSYVTREPKQGIMIRLNIFYNYTFEFHAKFDFSIENKFVLLNSIDFVDSFNKAAKIRLRLQEVKESDVHDLPPELRFDVKWIRELVQSIMIIETYTGEKFIIPEDFIEYTDFLKIQILSATIATKLCLLRPLEILMPKNDALKLVEAYKENKISHDSVVSYDFREVIQGKEIIIKNVVLNLSSVIPDTTLQELFKSIVSSTDADVKIRFEGTLEGEKDILLHIASLKKFDPFYEMEIPNNVKIFLSKEGYDSFSHKILKVFVTMLHDYLRTKQLNHSFKLDLFHDLDEDETEIYIAITVDKELSFISENLELPIYDLVDGNLPEEFALKITVELEPEPRKW